MMRLYFDSGRILTLTFDVRRFIGTILWFGAGVLVGSTCG